MTCFHKNRRDLPVEFEIKRLRMAAPRPSTSAAFLPSGSASGGRDFSGGGRGRARRLVRWLWERGEAGMEEGDVADMEEAAVMVAELAILANVGVAVDIESPAVALAVIEGSLDILSTSVRPDRNEATDCR
ncbi:uncharacterized protein LOC116267205 [Nymphaea colorata]|nr:uncharacterized protein LOC116267205 [Nymphaea colorata]